MQTPSCMNIAIYTHIILIMGGRFLLCNIYTLRSIYVQGGIYLEKVIKIDLHYRPIFYYNLQSGNFNGQKSRYQEKLTTSDTTIAILIVALLMPLLVTELVTLLVTLLVTVLVKLLS